MKRSYGKPTSRAARALRQKQALELLAKGAGTGEIASTLQISRSTLWRYFQEIEQKFDMELPADFKKAKLAQLARLREFICSGRISDGRIAELLMQVHDREVKLGPELKLNSGAGGNQVIETVNINITPEAIREMRKQNQEDLLCDASRLLLTAAPKVES